MLTDCAVALSTSPICAAMCMKRLLKISMRAGVGAEVLVAAAVSGAEGFTAACGGGGVGAEVLVAAAVSGAEAFTAACGGRAESGPIVGGTSEPVADATGAADISNINSPPGRRRARQPRSST